MIFDKCNHAMIIIKNQGIGSFVELVLHPWEDVYELLVFWEEAEQLGWSVYLFYGLYQETDSIVLGHCLRRNLAFLAQEGIIELFDSVPQLPVLKLVLLVFLLRSIIILPLSQSLLELIDLVL